LYGLNECRNIKNLYLFCFNAPQKFPGISALDFPPALKSLIIEGNVGVVDLADIARLTDLTRIAFHNCDEIRNVNYLSELPNLKFLTIRNCGKIDITTLSSNPGLKLNYKA
jgi:hypothetical protein